MKITRFIGLWAIVAALAVSQVPCMAFGSAIVENKSESNDMETAILAVKEKIAIPAELTEFASAYSTYNGEDLYEFTWSTADGYDYENMEISCDKQGRIRRYYSYERNDSQKNYIGVTLAQAQTYAEEFLRQIAPEAFANENDKYVCVEHMSDYYTSRMMYTFVFERQHNGKPVRFNEANVNVYIYGDEMEVSNASVGYRYDAVFEEEREEITNADDRYKQAFPLEMIYTDYTKYKAAGNAEENIYLAYRTADSGYISAYTGEAVEEPVNEAMPLYSTMETSLADMEAGGANKVQLTEAELAEVGKIASLVSEEDSIRYLKSIPMLDIAEMDMAMYASGLRATDKEHNEYSRYFEFDAAGENRYVNASIDAVRGRLLYFMDSKAYKPSATDAPMSEAEISDKNAKIDEFISTVASDVIDEFVLEEKKENQSEFTRNYARMVNGIKYINDGIYVNYNAQTDKLGQYSLTYNNNAEFADPSRAVSAETAYNSLLSAAPLEKAYVEFDDEYRLVYYQTSSLLIDALTGERLIRNPDSYVPREAVYTDTDSHWSRDKVGFLRDMGIAFEGPELNPDMAITQADILRIFGAGTNGGWYMTTDIEYLYDSAYSVGAITKEERSDDSAVTREQAFKYMVSFMNYGTVAKLPDIYKVKYADGDMLSDGMLGYAAILSGMGIINGDGSTIRPKDYITRAEALTMVYNYLTSPIR